MTWTLFWNLKHTYLINIQTIFFFDKQQRRQIIQFLVQYLFLTNNRKTHCDFFSCEILSRNQEKIQVKKFQTQPVKPDHFKRVFWQKPCLF